MQITTFNPLIITKDPEAAIALFEELGFERHHTKTGISESNTTDVRMKSENGFYVDIASGEAEYTMIRMNVRDLDETIQFLLDHGFRKARHAVADKTIDTGSSRFQIMVAPTGFILSVSEHFRKHD